MNPYIAPNGCSWICDVCGQPVGEYDMVGYFQNIPYLGADATPIPHTLGFWHNNMNCGNPARRGPNAYPSDLHIRDFVRIIPQELYDWLMDGIAPEEVGIMTMRCLLPGYEQTFRDYKNARARGIIEPNLRPPALGPNEIDAILQWQQQGRP